MSHELKAIPNLPDEREYPAELIERYELMECFTDKPDSRTLLARDRESGDMAVVKCYLKGSLLYERAEPEALKALDAPPLPRFIAEYTGDAMRCALREYVPGEPLDKAAARRKFSEDEVIDIGLRLCDQLIALHGLHPPVIHRDIKPQNVVLRPDGMAVLIDFGIARVVSGGAGGDTVVYGTQGFAPPEQYGFAATDCRSDIYSLGMLLQWLRTGQARPPQSPEAPLERVIARCAAFDPARRFSDIGQVKRALQSAKPAARRRAKLLRALAAVCAVALIGLGVFAIRQRANRAAEFAEPLIERSARMNLGLADGQNLTRDRLDDVTGIYIVAGEAYPNADSFYAAVNQWYAAGKPGNGNTASLEDLAQLPNVTQVCVAAEALTDISPVARLKNLQSVEFKHNTIEDISPLAGIVGLRNVGLNSNPVRDISPLLDCPGLAFLDLCDVRSYDPAVVAELGNFDFLDLSNPTESYNYLDGKSVLALRLSWTGLTSLDALDGVTRLEDLQIAHTAVSDLSHLALHPGLKTLNIAAISADDLSPVLALPQLQTLLVSADMLPLVKALGEVPFSVSVE